MDYLEIDSPEFERYITTDVLFSDSVFEKGRTQMVDFDMLKNPKIFIKMDYLVMLSFCKDINEEVD